MPQTTQVPVLVVGAGPAGLTTSLLLARHGVPALCVDRRSEVSHLPRARGVHARAVEILRVCEVEADMRRLGLDIDPGAEWRPDLASRPSRSIVTGGPQMAEVSPSEGLAIAQDVFELVLRDHVHSNGLAELRPGTELESFEAGDDKVDAVLLDRTTGQRSTLRARYLVGADGWRSSVRQGLGIPLNGPSDLGSQRAITFRADLSPWTGPRPRGIYFLTGASAALFWTHPDHRWALSVPDDGRPTDPEDPENLLRRALGGLTVHLEILTDSRWTAAAQNAERFASGPVFLVGDAAHRVPPTGATGVSSAMADAHNLAWKLSAVHHGYAGQALLDTYATEREAVARITTEEARAAWVAMSQPDAVPFSGRSLRQLDMGYQYRSTAVLPDGSPSTDLSADYVPNAVPGGRAPHMWLSTAGGARSTIDLFDREFVLLTGRDGAPWRPAVDAVARSSQAPLKSHLIEDAAWPDLYGVTSSGGVLVRPDGHVAWRRRDIGGPSGAVHRDDLTNQLAEALAHVTSAAYHPTAPTPPGTA